MNVIQRAKCLARPEVESFLLLRLNRKSHVLDVFRSDAQHGVVRRIRTANQRSRHARDITLIRFARYLVARFDVDGEFFANRRRQFLIVEVLFNVVTPNETIPRFTTKQIWFCNAFIGSDIDFAIAIGVDAFVDDSIIAFVVFALVEHDVDIIEARFPRHFADAFVTSLTFGQ